ncbi:hypothetical protein B0H67DRAFT_638426 [Lasiosphaeris hirsuta]|uniref:Uncharacterized protein n=1 Tax=Lasiosphaeris hirsuta TaxID=260670 RepID=A0AA40B8Y8_9PEZI|nr:hypothetical protein B0H67DRAFT_638426 [Lasiosphaeris hirsuta]
MKVSNLYLALQLAPLAMSAPVPFGLTKHTKPGSHDTYDYKVMPKTTWRLRRPKFAPDVLFFDDDADEIPLNNRPVTLSKSTPTSEALAIPRPIPTEYLLVIESDSNSGATSEKTSHDVSSLDGDDLFDIAELDIAIGIPSARLGAPCQYARLSRERNDVLVVCLAVAFLLIVLTVETWGSLCRSARRSLRKEGAIRLEEELTCEPLSIQACLSAPETADREKTDYQTESPDRPLLR